MVTIVWPGFFELQQTATTALFHRMIDRHTDRISVFSSALLVGLGLLVLSLPVIAHKSSDSYLTLRVGAQRISGQWDIALRDLEYAIGLDADQNHAITWGELRARQSAVTNYAFSHLQVASGAASCPIEATAFQVDKHSDGGYAVLKFRVFCPIPVVRLEIEYNLLFDLDPQHRGLFQINQASDTRTAIFSPAQNKQTFELDHTQTSRAFLQYLNEGIWHIFSGYDHLLFLLSLLLPAVYRLDRSKWQPVERFYPAGIEVTKIVTAFTVAHSITLSLAVLGILSIASRWVESAIAASVILAACNNLYPLVRSQRWLIAFGFGLVHGLGFASVLLDLGLPNHALFIALFAFNLGVEIGQLAIVGIFLPVSYSLRHSRWYLLFGLRGGSAAIALLALFWFVERGLNIRILT